VSAVRNLHRQFFVFVLLTGSALLPGCGTFERDPAVDAKQSWQSARAPQDQDQLRNRLMTSQTDR